MSDATKQLRVDVGQLADACPEHRAALASGGTVVRQRVVAMIQAGKAALAAPSDAAKQTAMHSAGSEVARAVKALLATSSTAVADAVALSQAAEDDAPPP